MSPIRKIRAFILDTYLFSDDESLLDDEASFLETGIIDSTGIVELIAFLEEEFGIAVSTEEFTPENLDSVQKVAAFVERKTGRPTGFADAPR